MKRAPRSLQHHVLYRKYNGQDSEISALLGKCGFIGVDKREVAKKVRKLVPDYMPMGTAGMADMGEMEMPLPDNTLPMMTGWGQFGSIEMGGMFSVVKVREGLAANDYKDPGWFKHPDGTVAFEWKGEPKKAERAPSPPATGRTAEFNVVKPGSKSSHDNH